MAKKNSVVGKRAWRFTMRNGPGGMNMNKYDVLGDTIEKANVKVRRVAKNSGTETIVAAEQIAYFDA